MISKNACIKFMFIKHLTPPNGGLFPNFLPTVLIEIKVDFDHNLYYFEYSCICLAMQNVKGI